MQSCPRPYRLFVELELDGERHCFEFEANDERAVVVGSSPWAHLRVERPGVSPVAFHLERERDVIRVTPGYETELRLNTGLVKQRALLGERATLEFHGIALQARISSAPPAAEPSPSRATPKAVRRPLLDQAVDAETTRIAVPPRKQAGPVLATNTVEHGASRDSVHFDLCHDTDHVQYFMTEVIRVPSPGGAPEDSIAPSSRAQALPPSVPSSAAPPAAPASNSAANRHSIPPLSLDAETTAFEAVQPGRIAVFAPKASLELEDTPWLTRLGLLTKARPLPVLMTALGVALLFGVLAASTSLLFAPTSASATASAAPKLPAGARSSVGSAAPPVSPRPRSHVATVASAIAKAPDQGRSAATASDPELARAVGALGAGRYADAAQAYWSVAARAPDSKVYRTIARLLEKASSPDCRPSNAAEPSCPEVQP